MKAIAPWLFLVSVILTVYGCKDIPDTNSASVDPAQTTSVDYCKKLDGSIFRYHDTSDLSDFPKELITPDSVQFTIIFRCENDSLKALMFGPDPEGEHGMFYFKTDLDSLKIDNSFVSFSMTYGDLYWKPYTLNNYNKDFSNEVQGGSNGRQFFKGRLAGDSIVFTCDDGDMGDCYDHTMIFKKK